MPILAQKPFEGSFLMSFDSAEPDKDPPLLWNIKADSTGNEMALQVQDHMLQRGVNKRVVFRPADSTWTMLISFNNIKQGTRIHGAAMYRDTIRHRAFTMKSTNEKKVIEGFNCKKIIVESENYSAEIWVTNSINFDLCKVYRLLSHCGMMSDVVRKGDWFMNRKLKSMVMEVVSTNKNSGQNYKMKISGINKSIKPDFFETNGFKISNIPEGQNCGVEMKEEN